MKFVRFLLKNLGDVGFRALGFGDLGFRAWGVLGDLGEECIIIIADLLISTPNIYTHQWSSGTMLTLRYIIN